jgi:hypothetical protein
MSPAERGSRDLVDPSLYPWLRLLRCVGLALDGKKMVLGALGLVLLWAGWRGLDAVFPASAEITPPLAPLIPWLHRTAALAPVAAMAELVSDPVRGPWTPFRAMFDLGLGPVRFVHAVLATIWAVAVWGIFGGAIARIAVVQAAVGERVGLPEALRFAVRKAVPLVGAPLTALAGAAFFAALCGVLGLLYRIPGSWGPSVAGAASFLPLIAGLVMALILAGALAGWPLMVATVAAEGEDTFDALSRSYNYVYARPARLAGYVFVAWIAGIAGLFLVSVFAHGIVRLAAWGLSFGAPDFLLIDYIYTDLEPETLPAMIHSWWYARLVPLLVLGWIYAFFWSSAAMIYLLLRQDVDGTVWEDIRWPERARATASEPAPAQAHDPVTNSPSNTDPTTGNSESSTS